jgi:uncharacterized Zn ribbon protein
MASEFFKLAVKKYNTNEIDSIDPQDESPAFFQKQNRINGNGDSDTGSSAFDNFDISKLKRSITYNPVKYNTLNVDTDNAPGSLPSILFQSGKQALNVPPARTDTQELFIMFNEVSRKLSGIENEIAAIRSDIFQIENNNNVSDSNLKDFLTKQIKETLENKGKELEDGEVVVVIKNAPVKELTRIDKEGVERLLEEGIKIYISDTLTNLSHQLCEAKKLENNDKKEDPESRKQRNNILVAEHQENIETQMPWSDIVDNSSQEG